MRNVAVVFALAFTLSLACFNSSAQKRPSVDSSITINELGKPAEFRRFLTNLKKEVAAGNRTALAKMMDYPLSVSGGAIKVFSEKDFLTHYDSIFTPSVVAAVKKQTYETLFVRDMGAMVGHGQVWFTGVCTNSSCKKRVPKVITVNAPDDEMAAAAAAANKSATNAPDSNAENAIIIGTSLPEGTPPGPFGPCRLLPVHVKSGSMTIADALSSDDSHCYRLSGENGKIVHIELKSVNLGFRIRNLDVENRYDLKFKARNQVYDIELSHTFPGNYFDHYELVITIQ